MFLNQPLKQRIVGIIVLLLLAIVFVPMIFNKDEEKKIEEIDLLSEIPEPPMVDEIKNTDIRSVETPIVNDSEASNIVNKLESQPETPIEDDEGMPVNNFQKENIEVQSNPITSEKSEDNVNKENLDNIDSATNIALPNSRLDKNDLPVSWSLQVGSFSKQENANKLRDELRKSGYKAYSRNNNEYYRVFVGPVIDKEVIVNMQQQIEKQFNIKGFVVEFQAN